MNTDAMTECERQAWLTASSLAGRVSRLTEQVATLSESCDRARKTSLQNLGELEALHEAASRCVTPDGTVVTANLPALLALLYPAADGLRAVA